MSWPSPSLNEIYPQYRKNNCELAPTARAYLVKNSIGDSEATASRGADL
jgi:hypothetical protein